MKQRINRVAEELKLWREREKRFENIFPGILQNKVLKQEKLIYFNKLQAKYGRSANEEERIALRILRQERDKLEKFIYPSIITRVLRLLTSNFRKRKTEGNVIKQSTANLKALKDKLLNSGFGEVTQKMEQQIRQGANQFSIPLSYYVNSHERMDFNLSFIKKEDGDYILNDYKATLKEESMPRCQKTQTFNSDQLDNISAEQAYNLLAGRAIQIGSLGHSAESKKSWLQLDFNDKNVTGNYKVKKFTHQDDYNLKALLMEIQKVVSKSDLNIDKTITSLQNGNRVPITIEKVGSKDTFYLSANPQFKTVNLLDNENWKVNIKEILSKKPTPKHSIKNNENIDIKRQMTTRSTKRIGI